MSMFTAAVMTWLVMGAIGYSPWAPAYYDSLMFLAAALLYAQVMMLTLALQTEAGQRVGGAYTNPAVVGWGLTVSYVFLTPTWDFYFKGLFWALSGLYLGVLLEATTGVYGTISGTMTAGQ